MSPQVVVDEHLHHIVVTEALKRWTTAEQIGVEIVRAKGRSDESLISLLRSLKRRTFITIDDWFYVTKPTVSFIFISFQKNRLKSQFSFGDYSKFQVLLYNSGTHGKSCTGEPGRDSLL